MKAIIPVFDTAREKPYYLQLYNYIKQAISAGEMNEGERLPSLRNLARSTGLSITTIAQSYNQLLVEGYIYSRPQSGYFVSRVSEFPEGVIRPRGAACQNGSPYPKGAMHPGDEGRGEETVPVKDDIFMQELSAIGNGSGEGTGVMQFDPECFDFNKWKKCMNRILTDFSPALLFESDARGERSLRAEISRYLYMSRGVSCSPEQIIIGAGTQQTTNLLATLLRKQGIEHVAIENPGYMPVRNAFRDRGFAITPVDVASDGPVIERLPANIRAAAYVSPSNNAFTGSVMPIGRRYDLLNWAMANDSFIIEDDYDSELRYFGKPIPALKSLKRNERVIYLSSFSSTLFAAVKISYMALPESFAGIFSSIAGDYSQTCSKTEQLTLAMFMETGYYQTHLKKLRKLYSQKLTRVAAVFEEKAPDFIDVTNTSSGINILLDIHSPKSPEQLKKEALSVGLHSAPLGDFTAPGGEGRPGGGSGKASLILYYNQIPLRDISRVITELIAIWRGR